MDSSAMSGCNLDLANINCKMSRCNLDLDLANVNCKVRNIGKEYNEKLWCSKESDNKFAFHISTNNEITDDLVKNLLNKQTDETPRYIQKPRSSHACNLQKESRQEKRLVSSKAHVPTVIKGEPQVQLHSSSPTTSSNLSPDPRNHPTSYPQETSLAINDKLDDSAESIIDAESDSGHTSYGLAFHCSECHSLIADQCRGTHKHTWTVFLGSHYTFLASAVFFNNTRKEAQFLLAVSKSITLPNTVRRTPSDLSLSSSISTHTTMSTCSTIFSCTSLTSNLFIYKISALLYDLVDSAALKKEVETNTQTSLSAHSLPCLVINSVHLVPTFCQYSTPACTIILTFCAQCLPASKLTTLTLQCLATLKLATSNQQYLPSLKLAPLIPRCFSALELATSTPQSLSIPKLTTSTLQCLPALKLATSTPQCLSTPKLTTSTRQCLPALKLATSTPQCLSTPKMTTSISQCFSTPKLATSTPQCLPALKLATSTPLCLPALKLATSTPQSLSIPKLTTSTPQCLSTPKLTTLISQYLSVPKLTTSISQCLSTPKLTTSTPQCLSTPKLTTSTPQCLSTPKLTTSTPQCLSTPKLTTSTPQCLSTPKLTTSTPHCLPALKLTTSAPQCLSTPKLTTSISQYLSVPKLTTSISQYLSTPKLTTSISQCLSTPKLTTTTLPAICSHSVPPGFALYRCPYNVPMLDLTKIKGVLLQILYIMARLYHHQMNFIMQEIRPSSTYPCKSCNSKSKQKRKTSHSGSQNSNTNSSQRHHGAQQSSGVSCGSTPLGGSGGDNGGDDEDNKDRKKPPWGPPPFAPSTDYRKLKRKQEKKVLRRTSKQQPPPAFDDTTYFLGSISKKSGKKEESSTLLSPDSHVMVTEEVRKWPRKIKWPPMEQSSSTHPNDGLLQGALHLQQDHLPARDKKPSFHHPHKTTISRLTPGVSYANVVSNEYSTRVKLPHLPHQTSTTQETDKDEKNDSKESLVAGIFLWQDTGQSSKSVSGSKEESYLSLENNSSNLSQDDSTTIHGSLDITGDVKLLTTDDNVSPVLTETIAHTSIEEGQSPPISVDQPHFQAVIKHFNEPFSYEHEDIVSATPFSSPLPVSESFGSFVESQQLLHHHPEVVPGAHLVIIPTYHFVPEDEQANIIEGNPLPFVPPDPHPQIAPDPVQNGIAIPIQNHAIQGFNVLIGPPMPLADIELDNNQQEPHVPAVIQPVPHMPQAAGVPNGLHFEAALHQPVDDVGVQAAGVPNGLHFEVALHQPVDDVGVQAAGVPNGLHFEVALHQPVDDVGVQAAGVPNGLHFEAALHQPVDDVGVQAAGVPNGLHFEVALHQPVDDVGVQAGGAGGAVMGGGAQFHDVHIPPMQPEVEEPLSVVETTETHIVEQQLDGETIPVAFTCTHYTEEYMEHFQH